MENAYVRRCVAGDVLMLMLPNRVMGIEFLMSVTINRVPLPNVDDRSRPSLHYFSLSFHFLFFAHFGDRLWIPLWELHHLTLFANNKRICRVYISSMRKQNNRKSSINIRNNIV